MKMREERCEFVCTEAETCPYNCETCDYENNCDMCEKDGDCEAQEE